MSPILSALPSASALISLLLYVAIACVVIWAIIALVRWSGIAIPQPVWIILTAILCIVGILLIAKVFGFAV
jgi:hypothetical protein